MEKQVRQMTDLHVKNLFQSKLEKLFNYNIEQELPHQRADLQLEKLEESKSHGFVYFQYRIRTKRHHKTSSPGSDVSGSLNKSMLHTDGRRCIRQ